MNPEGIMLSEIRQRKTNIVWFHSYVKDKTNKQNKTKNQTHISIEQISGYQGEKGWWSGQNRWRGWMVMDGNQTCGGDHFVVYTDAKL